VWEDFAIWICCFTSASALIDTAVAAFAGCNLCTRSGCRPLLTFAVDRGCVQMGFARDYDVSIAAKSGCGLVALDKV
jgi:hypothetical protein